MAANCWTRNFKRIRLVIAIATLLICAFDLCTDWYTFAEFLRYWTTTLDRNLMIALGVSSGIGSLLFLFELRNCLIEIRTLTDRSEAGDEERKSAESWWEVITFCQVTIEDAPVAIVMYFAFHEGGCPLFMDIFRETIVGNLALLGSFSSACWKVLTSLFYCCCGCCIRSGQNCVRDTYCCCCCRTFRSVVAFLVLTFTAYLFFTFNYRGLEIRPDCAVNSTLTSQ